MYASAFATPLFLVYRTFVLSHLKRYDELFSRPSILCILYPEPWAIARFSFRLKLVSTSSGQYFLENVSRWDIICPTSNATILAEDLPIYKNQEDIMKDERFGRIIGNAAVCFVFCAGLALAAEIFSANACYLLLIGIICCMGLPYTRWGLKIMHQHIGCREGVAVDFHSRAPKDFLDSGGNTRGVFSWSTGRPPLLSRGRTFLAALLIFCRLLSTDSGRQPDNLR